jgi:hypothetical protein
VVVPVDAYGYGPGPREPPPPPAKAVADSATSTTAMVARFNSENLLMINFLEIDEIL